jgi:hypothetical protein
VARTAITLGFLDDLGYPALAEEPTESYGRTELSELPETLKP